LNRCTVVCWFLDRDRRSQSGQHCGSFPCGEGCSWGAGWWRGIATAAVPGLWRSTWRCHGLPSLWTRCNDPLLMSATLWLARHLIIYPLL
jgi:hypothetical protein